MNKFENIFKQIISSVVTFSGSITISFDAILYYPLYNFTYYIFTRMILLHPDLSVKLKYIF